MTDDIGENQAATRPMRRAHIHSANEENASCCFPLYANDAACETQGREFESQIVLIY